MRTFNDDNLHEFNENLSNAKWSSFRHPHARSDLCALNYNLINNVASFEEGCEEELEDPNEAYNDFIEEYSRIYNTCFPLKVLKGKQVNKFFCR